MLSIVISLKLTDVSKVRTSSIIRVAYEMSLNVCKTIFYPRKHSFSVNGCNIEESYFVLFKLLSQNLLGKLKETTNDKGQDSRSAAKIRKLDLMNVK